MDIFSTKVILTNSLRFISQTSACLMFNLSAKLCHFNRIYVSWPQLPRYMVAKVYQVLLYPQWAKQSPSNICLKLYVFTKIQFSQFLWTKPPHSLSRLGFLFEVKYDELLSYSFYFYFFPWIPDRTVADPVYVSTFFLSWSRSMRCISGKSSDRTTEINQVSREKSRKMTQISKKSNVEVR